MRQFNIIRQFKISKNNTKKFQNFKFRNCFYFSNQSTFIGIPIPWRRSIESKRSFHCSKRWQSTQVTNFSISYNNASGYTNASGNPNALFPPR